MAEKASSISPQVRLLEQINKLREVPPISNTGFHNIANHMGDFSGSFASGSSRSTTIRERIGIKDVELGLNPLGTDLLDIYKEIKGYFKAIQTLVADNNAFIEEMEEVTSWVVALEQDSFLPPMVDQVRGDGSEALEQKTLGAIIDSLMRQTRPLVQEVISASRNATMVMSQLSRHIEVDLDTSKHGLAALKKSTNSTIGEMHEKIMIIDTTCQKWEEQDERVNNIIFEMVQAMQYDDITAQRIEHVVHAMEKSEEKIGEVESGKKKEKDKAARWFALVMRISNDQLREISADLVSSVHTMNEHLTSIADVAEEQKQSITLCRNASMELQNDVTEIDYNISTLSRMRVFEESLTSEVLKTMSQSETSVYQTRRALEMLLMIAGRLKKMTSEMNTGKNGRLETLCNRIDELSQRITDEGNQRMGTIDSVTNQLHTISLSFSEKITPRLMRTNSKFRRIPLILHQIGASNNDIMTIMNESLADTQSTFTQVMLLSAEMTFQGLIEDKIGSVISNIKVLQEEVSGKEVVDELRNGNLSEMSKEFDDLAAMYTMASERKIHEAALGEENGAAEDDFDDIELF